MSVPDIFTATGLSVTSGTEECFVIPIGTNIRGVITRFYVVQTGGTRAGFTYSLFCNQAACPPGANPTANATVPAGLYNVVPTQTVASPYSDLQGTWPEDGVNHLWQPYSLGRDGRGASPAGGQQLYLKIAASSLAGCTFAASVTIIPSVYT